MRVTGIIFAIRRIKSQICHSSTRCDTDFISYDQDLDNMQDIVDNELE